MFEQSTPWQNTLIPHPYLPHHDIAPLTHTIFQDMIRRMTEHQYFFRTLSWCDNDEGCELRDSSRLHSMIVCLPAANYVIRPAGQSERRNSLILHQSCFGHFLRGTPHFLWEECPFNQLALLRYCTLVHTEAMEMGTARDVSGVCDLSLIDAWCRQLMIWWENHKLISDRRELLISACDKCPMPSTR